MGWIFRTYDDELKAWEVDLLWQAWTHMVFLIQNTQNREHRYGHPWPSG